MYEHEDDDVEDFAGHELVEPPSDVDTDDMSYLFPTTGPGEFRKLRDKKKKKKGKKNKKKKSKKS